MRDALAALQSGQAARAEQLAQSALSLTPLAIDWLSVWALSLSQQLRAADALPVYRQLTELQPVVAEHWSNLGNCLCELGREQDALVPLQQALRCGGNSAELHYALARAWIAHGEARPALEHVERALQRYPVDPEFRLLRARALVMLDEYEAAGQAIDALRRRIKLRQRLQFFEPGRGEFRVHARLQFPRCEQTASQQIGTAETLAELEQARVLRRGEASQEWC